MPDNRFHSLLSFFIPGFTLGNISPEQKQLPKTFLNSVRSKKGARVHVEVSTTTHSLVDISFSKLIFAWAFQEYLKQRKAWLQLRFCLASLARSLLVLSFVHSPKCPSRTSNALIVVQSTEDETMRQ